MLLYCDKCAVKSGNPITEEKIKGECGMCKRRLGAMNVMEEETHKKIINNISTETLEIEGIQVKQVEGFVPGTKLDEIEAGLPHRILREDRVLYFGSKNLTIAIPSTGKRIQINF